MELPVASETNHPDISGAGLMVSESHPQMRLAYVTSYDGRDIRHWSGIGFYIAKSLERRGVTVDYLGPLQDRGLWFVRAKSAFYRLAIRKRHVRSHDLILVRDYARQTAAKLARSGADWVFSPGTLPIAYLKCKQPIAFWADATFAAMLDFYPSFSNLHPKTVAEGMAMEQCALDRARLAIYSSEWAARSAINDYRADPAKVKVVPYGANVECDRTIAEIEALIDSRPTNRCKLLFLAVDWARKGGPLACAIAQRLNDTGVPTELTVVGCQPPRRRDLPPCVHCEDFITKSSPEGRTRLDALFAQSHFLILPSLADCTPIVIPEANSFGVPCLTTSIGGIPTVVRNGVNGRTFALAASAEEYSNCIRALISRYEDYRRLALCSFNEYQTRLNWSVAAEAVESLLLEHST